MEYQITESDTASVQSSLVCQTAEFSEHSDFILTQGANANLIS